MSTWLELAVVGVPGGGATDTFVEPDNSIGVASGLPEHPVKARIVNVENVEMVRRRRIVKHSA
jgi:hypothetical protein